MRHVLFRLSRFWAVLAGLLLLALVLGGRFCVSAVLSNIGMVKLNHSLGVSGRAASPQLLEDAERCFAHSLAWDAGNRAAHRGLGWTWEARGELARAAREWKQGGFSAEDFLMCADRAAFVGQEDVCRLWLRRAAVMQQ